MDTSAVSSGRNALKPSTREGHRSIPAWLRWTYTAFIAVFVPIYAMNYGPTNFLYFCDVALFLALLAVWTGHPLPASMGAVGILVPQLFWCLDFIATIFGVPFAGMTAYMFDETLPLHLRALSLFHGWLPFLLVFLVMRLGYDRRGFAGWTAMAVVLCLIAFFLMPAAGEPVASSAVPRNINYVFGFNDAQRQTWMPDGVYLVAWLAALTSLAYLPTHLVLRKFFVKAGTN